MTTTGVFRYVDPATLATGSRAWAKVDGDTTSFGLTKTPMTVYDLRAALGSETFNTDTAGFELHTAPSAQAGADPGLESEAGVRGAYYDEISELVRARLGAADVVIFDHTVRRHDPNAARQPVQRVHVDQTPAAAEARVRRHVDQAHIDKWLAGRYAIVNVWRPLLNPAVDFPLAVIDWRSTTLADMVPIDLLYPVRSETADDDDRGKEVLADPSSVESIAGYEVKGETYHVAPSASHRFYYAKDMTPDEVLFLKCFDSRGERRPNGKKGLADGSPHTAFEDPNTPPGSPSRQSIEVRCLVRWDE